LDCAEPARPAPFLQFRHRGSIYEGPRGEKRTAEDIQDVAIGYFGPADPEDPIHGQTWQAVQRAIAQANAEGGYHGKPFTLVSAWSQDPWGTGISQLAQLVYRAHVWAIIGGVDGPSTHLVEQVAAKARVPLVSPISTDKTVNLANVPWVYSLAPGDHLIAAVLAADIEQQVRSQPFVLLTAKDHDSYLLARELGKALAGRQLHPRAKYVYDPAENDPHPLVANCLAAGPRAVIVLADPVSSSRLVQKLRQAGFDGCIYGGPAFGRDTFVTQAGGLAGELAFPLMIERTDLKCSDPLLMELEEQSSSLQTTATTNAGEDFAALLAYDAAHLVVQAIRSAGLNRADINTALRAHSPVSGLSGRIQWDGLGANVRAPSLATLRCGRVVPLLRTGEAFP
jgi:ABC-type branched-subunit amino acid transport system substrate-binding protein